jgi:hypothetical protein
MPALECSLAYVLVCYVVLCCAVVSALCCSMLPYIIKCVTNNQTVLFGVIF